MLNNQERLYLFEDILGLMDPKIKNEKLSRKSPIFFQIFTLFECAFEIQIAQIAATERKVNQIYAFLCKLNMKTALPTSYSVAIIGHRIHQSPRVQ